MVIIIFISGLPAVSSISISSFNPNNNLTTKPKEIITLYRYGLDGKITEMQIEVEIEEVTDIYDAVEKKCMELVQNDEEFKEVIGNPNISRNITSIVKSRGKGFHLHFIFTVKWVKMIDFFQLLPPFQYRRLPIPIIYSKYKSDELAQTQITPIYDMANTSVITGPHSVSVIGFIGFKWWSGHISLLGFAIRTGFVGFSVYTKIKRL
jgi:hypothetical protein